MKAHTRWVIVGIVLAVALIALPTGALKSNAEETYFFFHGNIRSMSCSNTGFSFISDDAYNAPSSGYLLSYAITTSEGFNFDSGLYFPTAINPGESGIITDDLWFHDGWPAVLFSQAYQIVHTTSFWVDGEEVSQSVVTFECSAGEVRTLTLVSLVNTAFTADAPESGPGCDVLMPIPATAVVGTFVADAPAYWTPGKLTSPLVTITAGNSAWVIGQDASGAYYKIIWVCDFLWVPVNTLGPNYDAVWNGAPLPTAVVE